MGKLRISAWREGTRRPTLGVWVLRHAAWPTNKKNWKFMQSEFSDVIRITKIKWDRIHDWNSAMEVVQGEYAVEKNGSCTFLQSISLSMLRSGVKPEAYLTGNFWSKAKAKET